MLFMFGFGGLACSILEFSLSDALNVPGKIRVCFFIKQERNSRRTAGRRLLRFYRCLLTYLWICRNWRSRK